MTALSKFLVLLVIFLSTSLGDAFLNHAQLNHLIRFEESMSKPTVEPTKQTTSKQRKYSLSEKQDAELPSKITVSTTQFTSDTSYAFEAVHGMSHVHVKYIVTNRVTFSDKRDDEIQSKSPVESNSRPNEWQMSDKINLDSSGLRRSARSVVLSWREKVYSHSTTVLKSVKRSSKHACLVLFSSFCTIGAALNGGVHSHQVLAQSSSLLSNAIDSYH